MNRWGAILLLMFFLNCSKEKQGFENINGDRKIFIIGHAGSGFRSFKNAVPENSMHSISRAIEGFNADGIEIDLQLSSDSVLFLYHDDKLESKTNCEGCIYLNGSNTLNDCRYKDSDEKLARLEEVLNWASGRTIKPLIFLDLRDWVICPLPADNSFKVSYINSVIEILNRTNSWGWTFIESSDIDLLGTIKNRVPYARLIFAIGDQPSEIDLAAEKKMFGVIGENQHVSKELINYAHCKGLTVSLFSVSSSTGAKQCITKGPDFIQTDNIPVVQSLLEK